MSEDLYQDLQLPPGTANLGQGHIDLSGTLRDEDGYIILQPTPSNDPNEPLNWTSFEKALNFGIANFFVLMVFTTVDVGTVTWAAMAEELGFSYNFLNAGYAAGLGGLAIGCFFLIPSAVLFGRKPVYIFATFGMLLVNIGQAVFTTRTQYIALQVLSGLLGSVSEVLVQMTVADLFFVHQRATMNGIYTLIVSIGASLSLIPAGYIVINQGWRWVWWWCTIINAITLALVLFAYEESKYTREPDNLLHGQEPALAIGTKGGPSTHEKKDNVTLDSSAPDDSHTAISPPLRKSFVRRLMPVGPNSKVTVGTYWSHMWEPLLLLVRVPAVLFVAITYGFLLCWVAIMATTQATLFVEPPYNFSAIGIGNVNIASFIGSIIGIIYGGPLNDFYVVWIARRKGGIYEPESRLHMLAIPTLLLPMGLWLYGISIQKGEHWIIPLVGSAFANFGIGAISAITLTYVTDSYRGVVAEALVVVAYVRNGISTGITFAIGPWLTAEGPQNMFIALGCICLAIHLSFVPMTIWGRKSRVWTASFYGKLMAKTAAQA